MYTVLAVVLGLLGGGLLIFGATLAPRARASRRWPETVAKIVSVNMSRFWIGTGTLYYPDIRYEYTVGEEQFEGSRIGFVSTLPGFSHGAQIYVLQRTYPRGRQVQVRYNPANPRDSVLEPGIRAGLRKILWTGVVLVALAAAVATVAGLFDGVS